MALKSLSTFHDSRYLYTGLLAFTKTSGELPAIELEQRVRKGIEDYAAQQQRKYLLAERSPSYQKIPSYIISELTTYGLLERVDIGGIVFRLTVEGSKMLDLLSQRRGLVVRTQLAGLYLKTFSRALYFQKRLWELEESGGLRLPEVNYGALEPLKLYGTSHLETVINAVGNEIAAQLSSQFGIKPFKEQFVTKIAHALQNHKWQAEAKQKSFQATRRAIDDFMLPLFFPDFDISRPKYDVLRDRGDTFGLVNQRRFFGKLITWEHVYLTAWMEPPMQRPRDMDIDDFLTTKINSTMLWVHEPEWESFRDKFVRSLNSTWIKRRLPIGYARIVDLRNDVCLDLRISSKTFYDFMRNLSRENEFKIAFSSSPERYTTKAMPLYLDQGKIYNLVRLES